jgi:hypothetical protein
MRRALPLESLTALYVLSYLPNVIITRLVTTRPQPGLGRALTGLETLPASLIMNMAMTYIFILAMGWQRDAHQARVGGWQVPVPTRATALSGVGTALILFTVPLSLTFKGVSIPFIQLLMRGDILVIAPLVDLMYGRRVRWWSWVALAMVAVAVLVAVQQRGGFNLPPLAILTVILYTLGYFIRLSVMTRVAKNGDADNLRGYFVEEKIVALPLAIIALALISASGFGAQAGALWFGFVVVWGQSVVWSLVAIAVTLTIISVFAAMILLDRRENSYCVPLERSASLLAAVGGAWLLHLFWGQPAPTWGETVGASILVAAILLLWVAPRFDRFKA